MYFELGTLSTLEVFSCCGAWEEMSVLKYYLELKLAVSTSLAATEKSIPPAEAL